MNNKYKEYIKYTILILCSVIFAIFTYKVVADKTIYIDSIVYNYISNNIINKNRTEIVKVITNITSPIMVIITLLILVLAIKDKKIKISLVINLLGITIINNLIKVIIARPRPEINKLVTETGYSFPSGHSITSMVFYGYLVYLTYKYINNKKIKIPLIIFLILLIPTIGLSRIYLGVHYASDVLCGFLLGIIYLILFISISKKYLDIASSHAIEAAILLLYLYTEKYLNKKDDDLYDKIKLLISRIENNPKYNESIKSIIEDNLKKLKENKHINITRERMVLWL